MFDPILVPLDGSQLAECVLPHSVAIASPFDAEITLLRMLEKNQAGASAPLFDLLNWQINKTKATLYLEKTKARLQESKVRARATVLEGLVALPNVSTPPLKVIESPDPSPMVTTLVFRNSTRFVIVPPPTKATSYSMWPVPAAVVKVVA